MIHVAVLRPRYARLVLSGAKTIESRLAQSRRAPFGAIAAGDRVYFKVSAGPFIARARAAKVMFHEELTPSFVRALKRDHNHAILADPEYWRQKVSARFATLVWLEEVSGVSVGPLFPPLCGRGWLTLPDSAAGPLRPWRSRRARPGPGAHSQ